MRKKIVFTPKQKQFIADHYLKMSIRDMAKKLPYSASTIGKYMRANGLVVSKEVTAMKIAKKNKGRTSFTSEMDDFLKANYLDMPVKKIGRNIGKSYSDVILRLQQLGLELPKQIRIKNQFDSRLKKGCMSPNKGKTIDQFMTLEQKEAFIKQQFKPIKKYVSGYLKDYKRLSKYDAGYDMKLKCAKALGFKNVNQAISEFGVRGFMKNFDQWLLEQKHIKIDSNFKSNTDSICLNVEYNQLVKKWIAEMQASGLNNQDMVRVFKQADARLKELKNK